MKIRIMFLALALATFVLQSCEELLNGIPVTFTISEVATIDTFQQGTFFIEDEVETDAETHVATVGASLDDIQSIVINTVNVSIADLASGADFSAFDRVSVIIGADGLDEVEVASKEINGEASTSIDVDVVEVELADYLKQPTVSYKLLCETNSDITTAFDVNVSVNATIQVQIVE